LNSLDPKFYDTPRSHITNIGLNLTDDQPNSPKRNNTSNAQMQVPMQTAPKYGKNTARRSINSSPTDSEGGSTDEEWTEPKVGDRKTRPSDSSMENESIAITAGQSYMKMAGNPIPLPPKRMSLVLEKKLETSDTEENASPLMPIGPRDSSSYVEERYDFPRSYNVQGISSSHMNIGTMGSMTLIHENGHLMTSTPNLIHSGASTLDRSHMNFYSNAPPRENNIFSFDFTSTAPPPEVNRTLKPRKELNGYGTISAHQAPTVNRKLKPGTLSKVRGVEAPLTIDFLKISIFLSLS
jgi:protein daughter of sevenless